MIANYGLLALIMVLNSRETSGNWAIEHYFDWDVAYAQSH